MGRRYAASEYYLYHGDDVVGYGTAKQLATKFGVKEGNGYPLWGKSEFVSYEVIGNIHENPELLEGLND